MRVVIPAIGTRGDMQPFAALGSGLRSRGHEVRVATHECFRTYVNDQGLDFEPLPGDPRSLFEHPGWKDLRVTPMRALGHLRLIHDAFVGLHGQIGADQLVAAWADADAIIFNPTTTFAKFVADRLGQPSIMAAYVPIVATHRLPHPVLAPRLRLGGAGNYLSWVMGERLQRQTFQEPVRPAARKERGLRRLPVAGSPNSALWPPFPVLHGYSPTVVPRPDDWPPHVHVTGWWFSPASESSLPSDLDRFLTAGRPPLYVGFGSMKLSEPERLAAMLLEAVEDSGDRLLVSGIDTPALRARGEQVRICGEVPHDLLFPRVKAVVTHGGSGTIGQAMRAGRPILVTPFIFDQFFWGERIKALGAGPAPIPYAELSAKRLARGFIELAKPNVRAAAAGLAGRIGAEDGIGQAARVIEHSLA